MAVMNIYLVCVQHFEGVVTCKKTDHLISIMDKIVKAEVHRLVIADDDDRVAGMISLSDILTYLILRPCGEHLKFCKEEISFSHVFVDACGVMSTVCPERRDRDPKLWPEIGWDFKRLQSIENTIIDHFVVERCNLHAISAWGWGLNGACPPAKDHD